MGVTELFGSRGIAPTMELTPDQRRELYTAFRRFWDDLSTEEQKNAKAFEGRLEEFCVRCFEIGLTWEASAQTIKDEPEVRECWRHPGSWMVTQQGPDGMGRYLIGMDRGPGRKEYFFSAHTLEEWDSREGAEAALADWKRQEAVE